LIKKIKSSLFARVFLITSIMLLFVSLFVFGLLAWLMPQTYSNRLNTILDKRAQDFISELEQVPFSDSGGLFDQFVADTEINSVELYNSGGDWVALPAKEFDNEWEGNIAQTAVTGLGEISPVLSNISFPICRTIEVQQIRCFSLAAPLVALVCLPLDFSSACPAF